MAQSKEYLELELDKCKITIKHLEEGLWLHNQMKVIFEKELKEWN